MALRFLNSGYFAGKVGIGEESPDGNLEVVTSAIVSGASDTVNNVLIGLQAANRPTIILDTADTTYTNRTWNITNVGSAGKLFIGRNGLDVMVMDNSGKVGIGVTDPEKKLEVKSDTTYDGIMLDVLSSPEITFRDRGNSDTLMGTGRYALDGFHIDTYSGNAFFIKGSNRFVGIGLTDPDSKLDINAGVLNITAGPAVRISKGASPIGLIRYDTVVIEANDVATIRIGESDGTVSTIMSGDNNLRINSTDPIKFYTAGTTTGEGHGGQGGTFAMIIDNSQNVGIGTTSPGAKLEISHGGANNGLLLENTLNSSNYQIALNIRENEGLIFQRWIGGVFNGNLMRIGYTGAIKFDAYDSTNNTGTPTYMLGTDGSGNVVKVLGADIPGVPGGSGTTNYLARWTPNGDTLGIGSVFDNGNVGIGSTNPATKFVVQHTDGGSGIEFSMGANLNYIQSYNRATSDYIALKFDAEDIRFGTNNGSERMRIANGGEVLIGTTAAVSNVKLRIVQTANQWPMQIVSSYAYGLSIDTSLGTDSNAGSLQIYPNSGGGFIVRNDSKVGIGTTSPTEKLEVAGNIKITAALLSNQENTDVDTGTETVASVAIATYTAAFFDFVIKKTTNVRSGTVYACHDGTNVQFTETSTQDLGDTSDVTLSVVISGTNMELQATTTSDNWSIKSLIRAI